MDNDDLLTEIFLLLPAKTLIRFTSVSKKWRSLISSDYFCRFHTLLHPTPEPSLLLQTHVLQFFYMDDRTIYGGDEKRLIPSEQSSLPQNTPCMQRTHAPRIQSQNHLRSDHRTATKNSQEKLLRLQSNHP